MNQKLAGYRPGGQRAEYAATRILAPDQQLALAWDAIEQVKPEHLREWVDRSAIAPALAELALESIAGEQQVLAFLRPTAINAHRTYGGAMPMNAKARSARTRFAKPCAGGWLAYGHAPIEGGALVPVTYKPDVPRLSETGEPIKYERPAGATARPYFPPLDLTSAKRIAKRAGLNLPARLLLQPWDSWSAWCWLLKQPQVELVVDEGEKKAAAGCSAGWLTIGTAGIYGGCPRPKDATGRSWGAPALVAELAWLKTIRPAGAPLVIAFDASDKPRGIADIRAARRRLGRLLAADGHAVHVRELVQPEGATGFVKGTDDLLVHGGAEALAALPVLPFDQWLRESSVAALTDRLLHAVRLSHGRRLRTVDRHFRASDLPKTARLIALIGGMGSNKTGAFAESLQQQEGAAFSITHRRSLADDQGRRFGLAVLREGTVHHAQASGIAVSGELAPNRIERAAAARDGFVAVVDSFHIGGSCELRPEDCAGATLFIDEADAFLRHVLLSETAIARHRSESLANLTACCRAASRVVLAGAHIDELTLATFEQLLADDTKACILRSTLQPAAGRDATMLRRDDELLQQLRNLAEARQPHILHTSAQLAGSKWAARNLARIVRRWWPTARILTMDAETIREPGHPAAVAIRDPQLLLDFDVVIASPVLETGFSIEDPAGHFRAVLAHTSGHVTPAAFVQAMGRLRSPVPRFLWCSASGSRLANGAAFADEIERHKIEHAAHLVAASEAVSPDAGTFLRLWAKVAADHNWQAGHYRHAVAVLLGAEGYRVDRGDLADLAESNDLSEELAEIRDETVRRDTEAVAAAPRPDPDDVIELEKRRRLTPEQRRAIERAHIERELGLPHPTGEQVRLAREGAASQALLHLLMVNPQARQEWHAATLASLTPSQRSLAPDLTRCMAPSSRSELLARLSIERDGQQVPAINELLNLAGTGRSLPLAAFEQLQAKAIEQRHRWRERLGFDPGSGTVRTFVESLLKLLGYKLRRTERRSVVNGRQWYHYEVADLLQPLGRGQVQQHLLRTIAASRPVSKSL